MNSSSFSKLVLFPVTLWLVALYVFSTAHCCLHVKTLLPFFSQNKLTPINKDTNRAEWHDYTRLISLALSLFVSSTQESGYWHFPGLNHRQFRDKSGRSLHEHLCTCTHEHSKAVHGVCMWTVTEDRGVMVRLSASRVCDSVYIVQGQNWLCDTWRPLHGTRHRSCDHSLFPWWAVVLQEWLGL